MHDNLRLVIEARHLEMVNSILQRYIPEREVWAFGSRVHGTTKPYADLDLAIIGETPLPLAIYGGFADGFSDSDLPYRVDLVDWAATAPSFRERIAAAYVRLQASSGAAWS